MAEIQDNIEDPPSQPVASVPELSLATPDGVKLIIGSTGPKFESKKVGQGIEIVLNQRHFKDLPQAARFGLVKLAQHQQLKKDLRKNAKALMEEMNTNPRAIRTLQLKGLKNLTTTSPLLKEMLTVNPQELSLTNAFDYACEYYALTGGLPPSLPQEAAQAFNSMPKIGKGPHSGLHKLDALVSGMYKQEAERDLINSIYDARMQLHELEKKVTKEFKYKPQVGAGESEPLDPNSIETRVSPFYGGYYRGHICRFEPDSHEIIQEAGNAYLFESDDTLDRENLKIRTYETIYDPTKENLLEFPYDAMPFVESISPPSLAIYRSENGCFYLRPKSANTAPDTEKQKVSFEFAITPSQKTALVDPPEIEPEPWGILDTDAETFLSTLNSTPLSVFAKAKKCEAYVRKRFKYPADENARAEMNAQYLAAGRNSLSQICQHGIMDCYWSNIFCGQLLARLGLRHRVIAGHFVQKDPRFDFAAVAGIGHAWGEVWDGQAWQRIDATPPKEKPDEEDENPEETEEQEGDFGEPPSPPEEPQEELSLEEIRALFNELSTKGIEPSVQDRAEKMFEDRTGVSLEKWRAMERYIKQINATQIPAESSISGKPSSLAQEYEEIFNLIYKRREIPVESFRGPVAQSEGDELDDPVDAAIDLIAGESDPMGYKIRHEETQEHMDVTSFEDDSILDLTASMQGLPLAEQKKMVLSGLYNLMMLARRLGLDKYKTKMREPIRLRSCIHSFKGNTKVKQELNSEQVIDEKAICSVSDNIDHCEYGGGNLVGALTSYENSITPAQLEAIRKRKLVKVLTIVSDGEVTNQPRAIEIIASLRQKGIVVQGIGFGGQAQDIRVICHDAQNPDSGVVISDVTQATSVRHALLSKALKKL